MEDPVSQTATTLPQESDTDVLDQAPPDKVENNSDTESLSDLEMSEELGDEEPSDAPGTTADRLEKKKLEEIKSQIEGMSKEELNALLENVAKLNQINPNGQDFSRISDKDYLRMKLRNKMQQAGYRRHSKAALNIMQKKAEAADKKRKDKEKEEAAKQIKEEVSAKTLRNRRRRAKKKAKAKARKDGETSGTDASRVDKTDASEASAAE